jgi:hypothetical protein
LDLPNSGSSAYGSSILEPNVKLRHIAERAEKFKMMQRALKEAGMNVLWPLL